MRDDADVKLTETLPISGVEVVRPEDGNSARALSDLREDPDVLWAEADQRRQLATDPLAPLEWGLDNIGQTVWGTSFGTADADIDAPEAWTVTQGAGATVAVVDTGVDTSHPDLSDNLLPGRDFVDDDNDPVDGNGHGTHVTGTIAAAENGIGVVGVAPAAHVIPLRVLDNAGNGWGSDVAAAFAWAGDNHVRVVNASLGSGTVTTVEKQAIHDHPGTLYVVAAGNSSRQRRELAPVPVRLHRAERPVRRRERPQRPRRGLLQLRRHQRRPVRARRADRLDAAARPRQQPAHRRVRRDAGHLDGDALRHRRRRAGRVRAPELRGFADQGGAARQRRRDPGPRRQVGDRWAPQRRRRARRRTADPGLGPRARRHPHGRRQRPSRSTRRRHPRPRPRRPRSSPA